MHVCGVDGDLLHDGSTHLRIGLVLADIVHHLPDRSNHHIRTVDHDMMAAAAAMMRRLCGDRDFRLSRSLFQIGCAAMS